MSATGRRRAARALRARSGRPDRRETRPLVLQQEPLQLCVLRPEADHLVAHVSNNNLNLMTRPSIYEFAGGDDAFLALAAATTERCLADPELNHPFGQDLSPRHNENLAAYLAEVFGGPD